MITPPFRSATDDNVRLRFRQLGRRLPAMPPTLSTSTQPGFPFWHPAWGQYAPNRLPSILRVRFFPFGGRVRLRKAQFRLPQKSKTGKLRLFGAFHKHLSDPHLGRIILLSSPLFTRSPLSAHRSAVPCSQTAAVQMALGQHQVPGMLDQPAPGLDQPLLQTGQRPLVDLLRQHQPPPHDPKFSPNRSGGTSDLARAARRR